MMARSDGLSTVTDGGNGHNRRSSAAVDATGTANHARLASAIDLGADIEVGRRRLSTCCRHDDRERGGGKSDRRHTYDMPK